MLVVLFVVPFLVFHHGMVIWIKHPARLFRGQGVFCHGLPSFLFFSLLFGLFLFAFWNARTQALLDKKKATRDAGAQAQEGTAISSSVFFVVGKGGHDGNF